MEKKNTGLEISEQLLQSMIDSQIHLCKWVLKRERSWQKRPTKIFGEGEIKDIKYTPVDWVNFLDVVYEVFYIKHVVEWISKKLK